MSTAPVVETGEPIEDPGFRDFNPDGVIEQPFWDRYNARLEMPIAVTTSIFMFVAACALLVLFVSLDGKTDKTPVSLTTLGGDDDFGEGSPGDGGAVELNLGQPLNRAELNEIMKDISVNDLKETKEQIQLDLDGNVEIPEGSAVALATLDKELRNKILGAKSGNGGGTSGGDAAGGKGPGGFGASSTYARALRWVLKFDTSSGKDYVNQIGGIGGAIMVPVPPDNKKMHLFRDPTKPTSTIATDADFDHYNKMMRFEDPKPDLIAAVGQVLGLNFRPTAFFVYFPRELEEKLANLERNYQNKTPEQIRQTSFRVVLRGGKFDFVVIGQTLR
jgi:hypothetical protein